MKVNEVMNRNVYTINSDESVIEACKIMDKYRIGFLPVMKNDLLFGVITDRDIVIRAVARNCIGNTVEATCTSHGLTIASKDEDIKIVLEKMAKYQVKRIPIMDNGTIIGVIGIKDCIKHPDFATTLNKIYETQVTHPDYMIFENGNPHDSVKIDDFIL